MAKKPDRHAAILELITAHAVASQEDLRRLLAERAVSVTQATLSRDLRELGLVRVPTDDGARYVAQQSPGDDAIPALHTLLPQLFSRVDGVAEMAVLHTLSSGAQPISEAIDAEEWPEVIGTIAGENTILIVCRSARARQDVMARLTALSTGD